jgi:hypothetical protein
VAVDALESAAADERPRPGEGIRAIRIPPERRNRIIVIKLTENDDYWPQKRRASF